MEHLIALTVTPTPVPAIDEDQVTPGVIGFAVTAVFVVIIVLLLFDMVRRVRRVRYRAEAQAQIAEELGRDEDPDAQPTTRGR